MPVTRVTMFKITDAANRERVLAMYKNLQRDAIKDGKPYLLSVRAGSTLEDQRRQGYTLAAVTEFASLDDMQFYDDNCQTHAQLKAVAQSVHQGVMTVFFEPISLA